MRHDGRAMTPPPLRGTSPREGEEKIYRLHESGLVAAAPSALRCPAGVPRGVVPEMAKAGAVLASAYRNNRHIPAEPASFFLQIGHAPARNAASVVTYPTLANQRY